MRMTAGPLRSLGLLTLVAAAACSDDDGVRITPNTLPNATLGQLFQVQLDLEGDLGGTPRWTIPFGRLPSGFGGLVGPGDTVQPDGSVINGSVGIRGVPEEAGVFSFVLRAEGSEDVIQQSYTLRVVSPIDPLRITTGSPLPSGTVGTPYEALVGAAGGTQSSYGWELIREGSLPAGLELNPTGTLSTRIDGTPTESGSFMVGIRVTDSGSNVSTATLALSIQDGTIPLSIVTTRLPGASLGVPYDQLVTATGGTGTDYSWTFNELPAGLSLEGGTPSARITGTPTEVGASGVDFQVLDSGGNMATRSLTLTVSAPPALVIRTSSAAPARVNEPYSTRLRAFGGVPPYTWDAPEGLPQGLAIDGDAITGTPLVPGENQVTIEVEDSVGTTNQRDLLLAIESATLQVTTSALDDGEAGVPYTFSLEASGGVEPYVWTIEAGALPGGLTLSEDGVLSGTPGQFGLFPVRYRVEDADGAFATRELVLSIDTPAQALAIVTGNSLPEGRTNEGYLAQIEASGGTTIDYSWSVTSGNLPTGLSLEAEGTPSTFLLGFPTQTGSFDFTITVEDSGGQTASRAFDLTVVTSSTSGG